MPNDNKIPETKTQTTQEFWLDQIEKSKTDLRDYHEMGRKIQRIYRDSDRKERAPLSSSYNILYSNTETMMPILFSETPEVDVRAQDTTSIPARQAAKMLEDALSYNIKTPETSKAIKACVKDLLLPGLSVLRVCYNPAITQAEAERVEVDEDGFETTIDAVEEKVVFEELEYKYIHWDDLFFPNNRTWETLPWLSFRGLYTYEDAIEEFGLSIAGKLDYVYKDKSSKQGENVKGTANKFGLAEIWEVWDKTNRKVIWISKAKAISEPLRIDDDPLDLDNFYPIPEPMFSSTTNDQIEPVPLFVQYQDLAAELNEVSTRIRQNVNNLKRRGVYDSSIKELERLQEAGDNNFIGIKNFAQLQQKGGLKAVLDSEDLSQSIQVIQALYIERQEIINAIYQIMGYADILRGQSDPRETLGAQRIKSRFGTLRISYFQREVQRFIRDALRIAGQIIINKFEDKTIALQTSVPIEQVGVFKEILEQVAPSSVMVDVQTDSTIAADEIADKESIIEFTAAVSDFVERTPAMVQVLGLKAVSELLLVLLRKFKMGREIEQAVMDRVREAAQEAEQAKQNPQPSTEEQVLQLEQQKMQQEAAKDAANLQIKSAELQLKERELEIKAAEIGLKDANSKQELDLKAVEVALKNLALVAEAANPDDNAIVGV